MQIVITNTGKNKSVADVTRQSETGAQEDLHDSCYKKNRNSEKGEKVK